jgi:hypothetical protein
MELIKKEFLHGIDFIEYKNEQGQLHRTDGPAIEYKDGTKEWFINGKRHREDGPAVEYYTGTKFWYLNGKRYIENKWKEKVINLKLKRILTL